MAHITAMPEDAQLPQLQAVMDGAAMQNVFQRRLPGFAEGRLRIDGLKLTRMTYTPNKACRICYTLRVHDTISGREGDQILFGKTASNDEIANRREQARRETYAQPEFGPALYVLPELNLVLWGFPNDPALRQLRQLFDNNALCGYFREFWERFHFPPNVKLDGVATVLVKYVPELRCTLRHALHLGEAGDLTVYSKTFCHKTGGAQIFKTMLACWNAPVCQSGDILIPEPLFLIDEMNTFFMRGLAGTNADENLAALDLDRLVAEMGVALAGIQQCRLEGLAECADQDAMSEVAEAEKVLGSFDAAYIPRVAAIAETLREKFPGLTKIPPAPIHSAFRISQFLLVDGKLALIDFDDFLLGNPITDVASFVAHLLYLPLKGKITPAQSDSAISHFCEAYATHAPWGLPADVLAWQTAAHLVGKQAKKCIKRTKQHYRDIVDQLLNLAKDILEGKWGNGVKRNLVILFLCFFALSLMADFQARPRLRIENRSSARRYSLKIRNSPDE